MNVAELIEQLKTLDPSLPVCVNGYEGGVTEEFAVAAILVDRDARKGQSFEGEHSPISLHPFEETIEDYPNRMPVVLIDGRHVLDCVERP